MINQIKKILEIGVLKEAFPGGQFCTINDGIITCDFVGYKQIDPVKILNRGDEVYDIASLSKVISTSMIILNLIENNQLSFDTKIESILDMGFKDITIKDLMIHSSGLDADVKRANELLSKEALFELIKQTTINYEKGTKIVYSDIGYIILGLIVEKVCNKKLNVVADELVFRPLGMTDTNYRPDTYRVCPTEYRNSSVFNGLLRGQVHDEKSFIMDGLSGHAGVFSTAKDIAKFIQAMLSNEFILSREMIDKLYISQIEEKNQFDVYKNRALGFEKPFKDSLFYPYKDDMIMHTGFTGCHMFMNRKKQFGFVLLTNAVHPTRTNNQIFSYRDEIASLIINEWEGIK